MDLPDTLPPELSPYTFLVGRWERHRDVEEWVAAGDVLIGLKLTRDGYYELSMIRAADRVELVARSSASSAPIAMGVESPEAGVLTLPTLAGRAVAYTLAPDGRLESSATGKALPWRARDRVPAPELVAADDAFHAAVAAGGVEAWIAAFDPSGGHQWDDGANAIVAPGPAMAEHMFGTLVDGRLDWTPVTSGLGPSRDLGWTVGDWTWIATDGSTTQRGAYVTVWRRQPDGGWKVWFDTGDPIDAP